MARAGISACAQPVSGMLVSVVNGCVACREGVTEGIEWLTQRVQQSKRAHAKGTADQ